eukprot:gene36846-41705_t
MANMMVSAGDENADRRKLRNLKPGEHAYKAVDRDGLYAMVLASGVISFRFDYRINGRQETLVLGRHGTGEVWSGIEAKKIGLVDEIGSLESLVRRAPELKPFNFGPHESAIMRFASALGRSAAATVVDGSTFNLGRGLPSLH